MPKRIHIIINPAAGQDRPVLHTINRAFHPAQVDWEVLVTKKEGEARRYAEEALAAGVDAVGVYGGDGTVGEVMSAMIGSDVPLAIFPGGTANVLSVELGIPSDLAEALALVSGDVGTTRPLDVGQVGERHFLTRIGLGFEAEMVEGADRESKDRYGTLAYALSALQALTDPNVARYHLAVDGKEIECEGIACTIANVGSFGKTGLSLAPTIDPGDGLLDVFVVNKSDPGSLLGVAVSIVAGHESAEALQHWQGREVRVVAEPAQTVSVDGEVVEAGAVEARVIPGAVQVIVPKTAELRSG